MFAEFFDEHVNFLKCLILTAAICLLWITYISEKYNWDASLKKIILNSMKVVTALAVFGLLNFGFTHYRGGFFHGSDMYNSYMSAKYFRQTGYKYMHDASLVADSEHKRFFQKENEVLDQLSNRSIARPQIEARKNEWRHNFSETKWQNFKEDLEFFQGKQKPREWLGRDVDIGWWNWANTLQQPFTDSPVRLSYTVLLSSLIPVDTYIGAHLLAFSDLILIAIMGYFLYKTFRPETALLAITMLCCCYAPYFSWIGNSFLRMDWLLLIVLSICMMSKCKTFESGVLLAFASGIKLYPAIIVLCIAIKFLWDYYSNDIKNKKLLNFFTGYAAGIVLAIVISFIFVPDPLNAWKDYYQIMVNYLAKYETWKWGFRDLFAYAGETKNITNYDENKLSLIKLGRIESFMPIIVLASAAIGFLFLKLITRRDITYWETMALSVIPFFLLFQITKIDYIFVMLPIIALINFNDCLRLKTATLLLGTNIAMYLMATFQNTEFLLKFYYALFLCGSFVFYMGYMFFRPEMLEEKPAATAVAKPVKTSNVAVSKTKKPAAKKSRRK